MRKILLIVAVLIFVAPGCEYPNVVNVVNYPLPQVAGDWRISSYATGDTLGYARLWQEGLVVGGAAITREGYWIDLQGQAISGTTEVQLWGQDWVWGFEFRCTVSLTNNLMDVRYTVIDLATRTVQYESAMRWVRIPTEVQS